MVNCMTEILTIGIIFKNFINKNEIVKYVKDD